MSVLWTPAEIATELWLDADNPSNTITSGAVATLLDKSGLGFNLTQATTGERPTYNAASLNSLGTMHFDGTADHLERTTSSALLKNSSGSMTFIVCKYASSSPAAANWALGVRDSGTGMRRIYVGQNSSGLARIQATRTDGGTESFTDSAGALSTNWGIHCGVLDWTTRTISQYIDGVLDGSLNPTASTAGVTPNTNIARIRLGCSTTNIASSFFSGDIAEVVIVSNDVTSATRETIEGYLAWRWGLEANLPSGHPYESAAPTVARAEPGAGATAVSGYAPSVSTTAGVGAVAGAGGLLFGAFAPTVAISDLIYITPAVGSAVFTGRAPEAGTSVVTVPGLGAAVFAGVAPQVSVGVSAVVPLGSAVFTGRAPAAGASVIITPAPCSVDFDGLPPVALGSDNKTMLVLVGAAVITGRAPLAGNSGSTIPAVGAMAVTGFAPAVGFSGAALPGPGALNVSSYAPTVLVGNNTRVDVYLGVVRLTGHVPVVRYSGATVPGRGAATFTGHAPKANVKVSAHPGTGAAAFTGSAPTVVLASNQSTTVPVGNVQITLYPPAVRISGSAAPPAGSATFTGKAPSPYADPPTFTVTSVPLTRAKFVVLYPAARPTRRGGG